ncbi:hypothetical protein AMTRI_Chr01g130460 [Amborella trichopoda]|uniref:Membrane-associated kinase regulator 2 n=1 Tax=Amborella trichopoda TaxID=13333 RepID=W1P3Z0_AMBTC|nr:probable membrane-associated kinase regulator 2 [Amborella trichopoda]ERN04597.1 hypothetical protein AMTR_s00075p00125620 [Amborella trichopoda]|eukprot:XP_006842922.1 probable membrane-associated kinase regulator 2 [Amborella trichopoda]
MEAFSMLRYWKGGGGAAASASASITTISCMPQTAPPSQSLQTEESSTDEDEGPFFDLELALPDEDDSEQEEEQEDEGSDNEIKEFGFTLGDCGSSGQLDSGLSPAGEAAEDLFIKGHLLHLGSENNNQRPLQFPVSLLKSATKFRVFMLGFKKPTAKQSEQADSSSSSSQKQLSKLFTVKFKVEEVPLVSLFTRDSSRGSSKQAAVPAAAEANGSSLEEEGSGGLSDKEAKRAKDVVQKYLKMIKPFYVRVSKRYGEKLGFSGQLSPGKAASVVGEEEMEVNSCGEREAAAPPPPPPLVVSGQNAKTSGFPGGFRIVYKHLGKSRSANSAVGQTVHSQRRDDSLLQQQDGIQGAIAHCKRSFKSSKEAGESDCCDSVLDDLSLCMPSQKQHGVC